MKYCFLLSLLLFSAHHSIYAIDMRMWRVDENDGVNCLYVWLRMHDQLLSYDDVNIALGSGASHSLLELRAAAANLGLRSRAERLNPNDLTRDRLPVIAHLEHSPSLLGQFVVLLAVHNDQCHYIRNATVEVSSIDDFRRSWSGYVLERHEPSFWHAALSSVGLVLILVAGWIALRF